MLKKCLMLCLLLTFFSLLPLTHAQDIRTGPVDKFKATLIAFEEVPAISSTAGGTFSMTIAPGDTSFTYELTYSGLTGSVQQAHIHVGQKSVNGGIVVFYCTNLGNGPAGTQLCPGPNSGSVSGTIAPVDVIGGANAQGVAPGQFDEVLRAIRSGFVYVNVHTNLFPGGEIRGQLVPDLSK